MLLSQNQKSADDLIATLTTKHYNKYFYVLALHSTKDKDERLALLLCITRIMDQKFASKGPNGGVLWLLWKAETSQKNQQPKLVVSTCDKITKLNSAWKLRLVNSEKDS